MANFHTDMSTLMTAIKNRLLAYQDTTLSSVKTYKRGILPPLPAFPAIAILPDSERLFGYQSSREYRNDRTLNIELYTKGLKTDVILEDNMNIVNAVKDILKAEWELDDVEKNTYDLMIGEQTIGEPQPFRNTIVQKCTIPFTCRSLETLPAGTFSTTISDVSGRNLLDEVFSIINAYTYSVPVKVKKKATLPPCMAYPSIHVLEDMDFPERYGAGIDRPNRKFSIATFNKQLDKEALLDRLITVVEDIKDCLQENHRFNNKVCSSFISTIEYGSFALDTSALYSAFIMLETLGFDPVK